MWQKIGDYCWAILNAVIPIAFILWIINLDLDMHFHWHWNVITIYLLIALFILYPLFQVLRQRPIDIQPDERPHPGKTGPMADSRIFLAIFRDDWSSSSSIIMIFLAGIATIFSPLLLIGWYLWQHYDKRQQQKNDTENHRGYH